MKKAFWILGVIAVFFIGDRVGGLLLKQVVNDSQFRYSRLYTGRAQSDILLVGNSRGLIFYQPYIEEITGASTFNISYNGMPVDLAKTLVDDYLERYPAPKTMIVDVSMCDRDNPQLISGFNLYTPYSNNMATLIRNNDPTVFRAGQLSHLYRNNSEIFQRAMYYLKRSDEDWLLDREINEFLQANIVNEPDYTLGATDSIIRSLAGLVKAARDKGVRVHLVVNPYYPAFAKKITNLADVKKRIEKATGLPVRDYSISVTDVKSFGDYQHLNKYGSRKYLQLLLADGVL